MFSCTECERLYIVKERAESERRRSEERRGTELKEEEMKPNTVHIAKNEFYKKRF